MGLGYGLQVVDVEVVEVNELGFFAEASLRRGWEMVIHGTSPWNDRGIFNYT
jgi:hypothetical protein